MKKGGRGVQFLLTRNPKRIPALRSIATKALSQYDIGPTSFSTSAISTITMASQGQPSRKQPSGPLLRHFLQPMHWRGSIWMRPNGGLSSSGTQNIQSSTGQYSTQAGDPAQPVQHSVITASSFGFFLRAVTIPFERGSNFCSSGTIPGAFATSGALAISRDSTLSVKSLSARFIRKYGSKESVWQLPKPFPQRLKPGLEQTTCVGLEGPPPRSQAQKTYHYNPSPACYNAGASDSSSLAHHVPQTVLQTPLARAARRTCVAPLFHLAFPFLFRRHRLLRRIGPQ